MNDNTITNEKTDGFKPNKFISEGFGSSKIYCDDKNDKIVIESNMNIAKIYYSKYFETVINMNNAGNNINNINNILLEKNIINNEKIIQYIEIYKNFEDNYPEINNSVL